MSELQNDSIEPIQSEESQEVENLEQGAELAPDSETQHEQKAEADVNQDAIQKVINKKHFEAKEAERKAAEFQKQLEEYQRKEMEAQASRFQSLPEAPDPFEDNYDEKLKSYQQAIYEKAKFDAQNEAYQQQTLQQQQLEQAKKAQELQAKAQTYESRAKELGISKEEVQLTGQTLVNAGLNEDLANAILEDSDGPLMAKYLSANLSDLEVLQSSNPYLAGAKLNEIKQKANALKPKSSKAPEPATIVKGSTVDTESKRFVHSKGATFS